MKIETRSLASGLLSVNSLDQLRNMDCLTSLPLFLLRAPSIFRDRFLYFLFRSKASRYYLADTLSSNLITLKTISTSRHRRLEAVKVGHDHGHRIPRRLHEFPQPIETIDQFLSTPFYLLIAHRRHRQKNKSRWKIE